MNNIADDLNDAYNEGEWNMFSLISTAWYGKKCYFKQDDGSVYSRLSGKELTASEAVEEFIKYIEDGE